MNLIKPIETLYKGYRFRSRLEARWAVFFDRMSIEYVYEPEGYELNGLQYLPDFYLSRLGYFVEIKPATRAGLSIDEPEEGAYRKAEMLATVSDRNVYILCGEPYFISALGEFYEAFTTYDRDHYWCVCPGCGAVGLQYGARAERNNHEKQCPYDSEIKVYGESHPRLIAAYNAARSARFEFGENGSRR